MKSLFIIVAFLSCFAVKAQDTTKHRPIAIDTAAGDNRPVAKPQEPSPARSSEDYRDEDRIVIEPDQLPVAVQEALRAPEYSGWENFSVFQDRITGDYIIEMKRGTASTKSYRFNKNGKLLEDPNKPKKKD